MAAPNPNELQRINDLLKSIDDLYKKIGTENPFKNFNSRNFTDAATAIGQLEIGLRGAKDLFNSLTDDAQELYGAFKGIVNEIKNSNSSIKDSVKSYNKLGELARKLRDDEKGIHELSGKELKTIQSKLESEVQNLRLAQEMSKLRKQELDRKLRDRTISSKELKERRALGKTIHANNLFLKESNGLLDGLNEKSQKRLEKEKEINKKMGLGGALLSSLSKKLPGPLAEHLKLDEVTKKMEDVAKKGGGGLKVMGAGLKAAGGNMMSGMMSGSNPYLLIGGLLVKIAKFFIDAMFGADKQVTDLAKNLNISKESARGVRDAAFKIKENFSALVEVQKGNLLLQTEIVDTQIKFNNVLGMSVNLISGFGLEGQQVVAQLANMVSYLQLSDDELKGITNLYANTGKQIDNIKFQILGTARQQKMLTGLQIDERKVLKDVLTTSNAIRLSMKGGMDALIKSVAESQKLGKSLNELSRIGESLLNFEQSISSELEAELLLGRDLNLERARGAYFSGDMKSFQEEVNRLVKESGPDFKKNVIAQQALASALGISREELADMVTEQEKFEKFQNNMVKLSNRELEILQENLKAYGVKGKLSEATISQLKNGEITGSAFEKELKRIGLEGENLTEVLGKLSSHSLESSDAQAKFNKALESAKEIFTSFVDGGALDDLANFITQFVVSVQQKGLWDTLTGGIMSIDEVEQIKLDKLQNRKQILFQKENAGIISDQEKAELEGIDSKIKKQLEKIVSTSENTIAEKGGKASLSFYEDYIKGNIAYLGGLFASKGNTEVAKMAETVAEGYFLQQKQKEANEYASKNAEYAKRHLELLEIIAKKETNVNYDSQKASVAGAKRESAIG